MGIKEKWEKVVYAFFLSAALPILFGCVGIMAIVNPEATYREVEMWINKLRLGS